MRAKQINIIIALTAVLVFPLVSVLSLSYGIAMGSDGAMESCFFGNDANFCPMNWVKHLSLWQNAFVANLPKITLIYFALFLLISGLSLVLSVFKITPNKSLKTINNHKLYLKQKPDISLFEYLREVFSQGILKPKIYKLLIV